jgi:hypothetical protein
MMYMHVEPCWSDIDRGNPLIRPPKLSVNPASGHLVAKQHVLAKEIMNFACKVCLLYIEKFITCRKML